MQNAGLDEAQAGIKISGRNISNLKYTDDTTLKGESEKEWKFQKNSYFCFIDYAKAFECVVHNKLWKILTEMECQTSCHASWEICIHVKKQQIELDMEQQTGSK